MAAQSFRVIFTDPAWEDLGEIAEYWASRQEAERGSKYAGDLSKEAIRQLGDVNIARAGRFLRRPKYPKVQELVVFKRSYRFSIR